MALQKVTGSSLRASPSPSLSHFPFPLFSSSPSLVHCCCSPRIPSLPLLLTLTCAFLLLIQDFFCWSGYDSLPKDYSDYDKVCVAYPVGYDYSGSNYGTPAYEYGDKVGAPGHFTPGCWSGALLPDPSRHCPCELCKPDMHALQKLTDESF